MALNELPDNAVKFTLESMVKNRESNFMPSPGEFANLCKSLIRKQIKTNQADKDQNEVLELTHNEAKLLYHEINENLKAKNLLSGKYELPLGMPDIYEICDRQGKPVKWWSYGHLDFDEFREFCFKEYGVKPYNVSHRFRNDQRVYDKDDNGHVKSSYFSFMPCKENQKGATATTEGWS